MRRAVPHLTHTSSQRGAELSSEWVSTGTALPLRYNKLMGY